MSTGHADRQLVLLVEDDEDTGDVLRRILAILGYDCHVVRRGHDAVSFARTTHIDIALIDLGLPDLSGYEVARALRGTDAAIFLVALSGFSAAKHQTQAFKAGFDRYLVKPALRSEFEHVLADARSAPEPVVQHERVNTIAQ